MVRVLKLEMGKERKFNIYCECHELICHGSDKVRASIDLKIHFSVLFCLKRVFFLGEYVIRV